MSTPKNHANPRAEAAILGSVLLDNECYHRVAGLLSASDLHSPRHRTIWSAMGVLAESGQAIDTVTLSSQIRSSGGLQRIGGGAYLVELECVTPAGMHVEHYATIVRDLAAKRRVMDACRTTLADGEATDDVSDYLDRSQTALMAATEHGRSGSVVAVKDLMSEYYAGLERRMEDPDARVGATTTGFASLDRAIRGVEPAKLYVIGARPGMGKTALALQIARHAAIAGTGSLVFSMEMGQQEVAGRNVVYGTQTVGAGRLRDGRLRESDLTEVVAAIGAVPPDLYVDTTPALTLQQLAATTRTAYRRLGIRLIVVDYLQLMSGRSRGESRQQDVSEISRGLKALAGELEIPVVMLSQLNRGVELRSDKHPLMSDLRETGSIEQDADVITLLYRPGYYDREADQARLEIDVAKQRNGATGVVECEWVGYRAEVRDLEEVLK